MRKDESFLCSELVKVSTGASAEIANLEQINTSSCEVKMQEPLPVGTPVKMQCLECPQHKECCNDCIYFGRVRSHKVDPVLGSSIEVDFEGRNWSAKEWKPRHLLGIPPTSGQ
jgi:hypothetical protein